MVLGADSAATVSYDDGQTHGKYRNLANKIRSGEQDHVMGATAGEEEVAQTIRTALTNEDILGKARHCKPNRLISLLKQHLSVALQREGLVSNFQSLLAIPCLGSHALVRICRKEVGKQLSLMILGQEKWHECCGIGIKTMEPFFNVLKESF